MKIYNTLTRKKKLFKPREDKKIQMFVCGPTVYDYIHIGNARTFVVFDVVAKYFRHCGYDVNYIQNITDIDNKIIERAVAEKSDPLEYAKKYSDIFKQDMKALGVTSPEYKNATDHIPEVIKQVQTLLNRGNAYLIENDGIYFDLSTFFDYGKLSGRTANMADDAVSRIDDSDKKRNRGDFAIWKFSQKGDPAWSFETGKYMGIMDSADPAFSKACATAKASCDTRSAGRPGWHIEDTSITEKYFGPQYDIHGGGQDLMFPHHEAEIAQQESASGLKPFVKYWMHSGFLINKSEKMSKSLGNFKKLNELLKEYSPETLRLYFLSAHYRSPLDYDAKLIKQASYAINRIADFMAKLDKVSGNENSAVEEIIKESRDNFENAMNEDFNTPIALSALFNLIRKLNPLLISNELSKEQANKTLPHLNLFNEILGIMPKPQEQKIPKEVLELMDLRETFREAKNWQKADEKRAEIEKLGYQVEDTAYGSFISPRRTFS